MTTHTNHAHRQTHAFVQKVLGSFLLGILILGRPVFAISISAEGALLNHGHIEPVALPAPTVQDVLIHVCETRGYDEDCAKTLLGMLWTESSNKSTVIGDNGRARGYFQIHYKLHKISIACAEDLVCSANWTLTYMEAHSYPKYVNYAVQCHNSCGVRNGYTSKVTRYGKYFWDQPLTITQEAPIELAMK